MPWNVSRYRKLKRLSLVLAGMFTIVFLVSSKYVFAWSWNSGSVGVSSGCIVVSPLKPHPPRPATPDMEIIWKPVISYYGTALAVIPLWIPLSIAIAAAVVFDRKARLLSSGHCVKCGHNLTGYTSGACPECGTAAGAKQEA